MKSSSTSEVQPELHAMAQNKPGWQLLRTIVSKCTVTYFITTLITLLIIVFLVNYEMPLQTVLHRKFINVTGLVSFRPASKTTSNETPPKEALKAVQNTELTSKTSKSPKSSTSSPSVPSPSPSPLPQAATLTTIAASAKVSDVDCQAIFLGSENATRDAKVLTTKRRKPLGNDFYINATTDCERFQSSRGYIMSSLTEEEKNFPIAYSMLVYKDPEIIERLLRAIYRPQNVYCIHVDKKSPDDFQQAIEGLANCFPNVFIARQRLDVQWGTFTVLEPELVCMENLWRYKTWRYFINLTGQEFPLRTNYELVQMLIAFNGANSVHGTVKSANTDRWAKAGPAPHNIRPTKGSVHVAINRDFVDYILHNQTAKDFLEWVKKTNIPDETYFASLNHNPHLGIRGSFKGDPDSLPWGNLPLTRHKIWFNPPACAGRFMRGICVLTIGDLVRLGRSKKMFANKFFFNEDPVVIECLEERLFNNTRDDYLGTKTFNTTYYANQPFVLNQVL